MGLLEKVQCSGKPGSALSRGKQQLDSSFSEGERGNQQHGITWELVRNRKSQPSTPRPKTTAPETRCSGHLQAHESLRSTELDLGAVCR